MAALVLPEYYADLATTTLSSSYTAGAGVIVVTTAANLSTTRQFHFMITDATTGAVKCIGKATALTSSTFTVTMTTDANAASGDNVTIVQCAGAEDQIRADGCQFGTFANLPTVAKAGDRYKQTDGPYEWIYQSGAWQAFYNGWPATLPPSGSWTTEGLGASGFFSYTNGFGYMVSTSSSNSDALSMSYRTAPTAPYNIVVRVQQDASGLIESIVRGASPTLANAAGFAVGWRDSGGKYLVLMLDCSTGAGATFLVTKWNSITSVSSSPVSLSNTTQLAYIFTQGALFYKISRDGSSNLSISISIDGGNHWVVLYTATVTNFLADAANVAWGSYLHSEGAAICLFDWTQT